MIEKKEKRGRKPGALNELRKLSMSERIEQAEKAFNFLCNVVNNETYPLSARIEAAKDVQDRVFGKPKQAVEHSGNLTLEGLLSDSNPPRHKPL